MSRFLLLTAAILGATGMGIAAYHAHGLEKSLQDQGLVAEEVAKRMKQCDPAVRYHLLHAVAILAVSVSKVYDRRFARLASLFWLLGIFLFSGGLYSMVFFDRMGHWSIVPIGGISFILGWLSLVPLALSSRRRDP